LSHFPSAFCQRFGSTRHAGSAGAWNVSSRFANRCQHVAPVAEARQVDGNQGGDAWLAATSANDHPAFTRGYAWCSRASRVLLAHLEVRRRDGRPNSAARKTRHASQLEPWNHFPKSCGSTIASRMLMEDACNFRSTAAFVTIAALALRSEPLLC